MRGQTNGVIEKTISNKLNLIGAIDTNGSVYLSILHVDSNSEVFCLFMERLCKRLALERPDYKRTTVF